MKIWYMIMIFSEMLFHNFFLISAIVSSSSFHRLMFAKQQFSLIISKFILFFSTLRAFAGKKARYFLNSIYAKEKCG